MFATALGGARGRELDRCMIRPEVTLYLTSLPVTRPCLGATSDFAPLGRGTSRTQRVTECKMSCGQDCPSSLLPDSQAAHAPPPSSP